MSSLKLAVVSLGFVFTAEASLAAEKPASEKKSEAKIEIKSETKPETKIEGGEVRPPTAKVVVPEIVFKDTIVIHDRTISKDGGAIETVACSAELGGETFGYIQLDEKNKAELTCIDDYAGGISIVVPGAKTNQEEKLGEVIGDAGEALDTRSWITKKDKKITITTVTISSYQDPDAEDTAPIDCDKKAWVIEFDSKAKKLKRKSVPYSEKDFKFVPAAQVVEKCR